MAILDQCVYCGRLNGYAEKEGDKLCLRCKKLDRKDRGSAKKEENNNDNNADVNNEGDNLNNG